MRKEQLLTICREISEHKYTWGRGYRLIIKLLEDIEVEHQKELLEQDVLNKAQLKKLKNLPELIKLLRDA